jgi:hypothetical protein
MPGTSLHETGNPRMVNDPKEIVTNRFENSTDLPVS